MTKIVIYLFGKEFAKTISTRTIDKKHWYTALDLCRLLGIENHSLAVHRKRATDDLTLKASEWRKETIFNGLRKKHMLMVNDGGMLKLIFQGRSSLAKELQEKAPDTPSNLVPAEWADYWNEE